MEIKIRRNTAGDIIFQDSTRDRVFSGISARIDLFCEIHRALDEQDAVLKKVKEKI